MSKFFFCEDFFTSFFLKSAKGVSINYVDTFKTASSPSLDLCPHAWNKLAYSAGHTFNGGGTANIAGFSSPWKKISEIF